MFTSSECPQTPVVFVYFGCRLRFSSFRAPVNRRRQTTKESLQLVRVTWVIVKPAPFNGGAQARGPL